MSKLLLVVAAGDIRSIGGKPSKTTVLHKHNLSDFREQKVIRCSFHSENEATLGTHEIY